MNEVLCSCTTVFIIVESLLTKDTKIDRQTTFISRELEKQLSSWRLILRKKVLGKKRKKMLEELYLVWVDDIEWNMHVDNKN